MTEVKLKMAFEQCRELLPNYLTADRGGTWHRHLIYMCQEAAKFTNREKAMRWLGFIQGALWTNGAATIDELKDMNRPDEPDDNTDFIPCIVPPANMRVTKGFY